MQKTIEYTGNRVSPATIELLTRERKKGKNLRQLGQMFNRSHERMRQVLAEYRALRTSLLPETVVAAKLGYPKHWLTRLRKDGVIKPIRPGGFRLYSEEQVRQIPSLIAEARKCQQCGKPRPPRSRKFCRECSRYMKKTPAKALNPEVKTEHTKTNAIKDSPQPLGAAKPGEGRSAVEGLEYSKSLEKEVIDLDKINDKLCFNRLKSYRKED